MSIKLEARPQPSQLMSLLSPMLALVVTVLIGVLLFVLLGKDPLRGLQMFFVEPVKSLYALSELSVKATPLILIALGLALCFRSNVWNIGAEGQYIVGALFAGYVAMQAGPDTAWLGRGIVLPILLAGIVGGMLWAGIVALLRDRFNANEILVSLMLVYVAEMLLSYLVYGPWKDPRATTFRRPSPSARDKIPRLVTGLRAHIGVLIALFAVAAAWIFLFRMYRGFALQVGGLAPAAARYAGFSSRRCAVDGAAGFRWSRRACWRVGSGRAAGAVDAVRAGRLRFRRDHRGLRGAAAPGRDHLLRRADEHVLHRR
jgi:simple sugar transport system permease protein